MLKQLFRSTLQQTKRFTTNPIIKSQPLLYTEARATNKKGLSFYLKAGFLASVPVVTFYLGWWQQNRLQWKEDLIKLIEERSEAEPIILEGKDLKQVNLDELEYHNVIVKGHFLHDKEILLGPRTFENQLGYYLITPFKMADGQIILVKRGWIHKDKKDKNSRIESLANGEVILKGQIRKGEQGNRFTPDNEPYKGLWFYVNLEEMSQYCNSLPFLIDELADNSPYLNSKWIDQGIPVPRSKEIHISNNHLNYLVTWYSLSFITAIMTVMFIRGARPHLPNRKAHMVKSVKF